MARLHPASDFNRLDEAIERRHLRPIPAKRRGHKPAVLIEEVMVEVFLVRTSDQGTPHTIFLGLGGL